MLFPELHNEEDVIPIARRMRQTFHLPFEFDGFRIEITASIGISLYPQDGDVAETLLKNADRAMYRVKDQGRGAFRFFTTLRAKGQAGTERISTAAKAVPTSGRH